MDTYDVLDDALDNVRAAMRAMFGKRNFRIYKDGRVRVLGVYPGTNLRRWHRFGILVKGPNGEILVKEDRKL